MMKLIRYKIILFSALFIFSCGGVPSTDDIDKDIKVLDAQIEVAQNESEQYSGGLIKVVIDLRKEILMNSKAMLEQKKTGIKRFIKMKYTIDGKAYNPPRNKDELLISIQKDIDDNQAKRKQAKKESERYSGGLILAMLESQVATMDVTIATLEQKKLFLKYDIPLYSVMAHTDQGDRESEFMPTPGEDSDKL